MKVDLCGFTVQKMIFQAVDFCYPKQGYPAKHGTENHCVTKNLFLTLKSLFSFEISHFNRGKNDALIK